MNTTLRQALGATVDATPTANRTVPFYDALLGADLRGGQQHRHLEPAQAGHGEARFRRERAVRPRRDVHARGQVGLSRRVGRRHPRQRLAASSRCRNRWTNTTQDFGVRAAYNFTMGNVHASVNRNLYNNRAETFIFDNPFQPFDVPYTAAAGRFRPSAGRAAPRIHLAPDNEATHRPTAGSC